MCQTKIGKTGKGKKEAVEIVSNFSQWVKLKKFAKQAKMKGWIWSKNWQKGFICKKLQTPSIQILETLLVAVYSKYNVLGSFHQVTIM